VDDWLALHFTSIYRFALRLTGNPDAADDLVQEACLKAWRNRSRMRDPALARVWLLTITNNCWRDHLRWRKRAGAQVASLHSDHPGNGRTPADLLGQAEDVSRALRELDALPGRQREALYLHACEDLSLAEIANVLGVSPEAVKASLSLARKKMRSRLADMFEERCGKQTQ
jgi:RNA polymerase sigma-70 factor (ECF subfamily)